ncbi:type IV pilus assembly protein PilW [Thiohalospira halophila DSM 15071]|uniref:Type IV pilus assembly protein PilW n=1 Tax=Thiohalospira halophila DSM 15071 TaxID=1123397 RepID=A0A1I1PX45_9GAMM|nr:PilW family protein [Thiohalospira halophila]SFD14481.1 type IV pilus assembly protein PilW [Thiohalospira halophila DSM 15071]
MNRGFTLVELMIALAVGAILLAGIGSLVQGTHDSNRLQQNQAQVQGNARFALNQLGRDLLAAGHLGCTSTGRLEQLDVVSSGSAFRTDFTTAITGHEAAGSGPGDTLNRDNTAANWTPALPTALQGRVLAGSDVLILRRGRGPVLPLSREKGNDRIFVDPASGLDEGCSGDLCPGDQAVVTDCARARVFTVTAIQSVNSGAEHALVHGDGDDDGGNDTALWGGPAAGDQRYHFTAQNGLVQRVSTIAWFVGRSNGIPTLLRWADGDLTRIARGVETLQLFYGEDTDGDGTPNRYRPADQVGDFAEVITVRVDLLLAGDRPLRQPASNPVDDLGPGPGGNAGPGSRVRVTGNPDRLLREPVGLTFHLRNRGDGP